MRISINARVLLTLLNFYEKRNQTRMSISILLQFAISHGRYGLTFPNGSGPNLKLAHGYERTFTGRFSNVLSPLDCFARNWNIVKPLLNYKLPANFLHFARKA